MKKENKGNVSRELAKEDGINSDNAYGKMVCHVLVIGSNLEITAHFQNMVSFLVTTKSFDLFSIRYKLRTRMRIRLD